MLSARKAVVFLLIIVVMLCAGCGQQGGGSTAGSVSESPSVQVSESPSAGRIFADDVGPNGEVSQQVALDAFATFVGPIPGGDPVQPGTAEPTSGTTAIRWLGRWWPQLTAEQREAANAALSAPTQLTQDKHREDLQSFVDQVAQDLRERYRNEFFLLPTTVHVPIGPTEGKWAAVFPGGPNGEPLLEGRADTCILSFTGDAVRLFQTMRDSGAEESSRNTALVMLQSITAHELMHCHQLRTAGTAERWFGLPDWVAEGSAEWLGYLYAAPDRKIPDEVDWWDIFFLLPANNLFSRENDAVGFWAHREAPWQVLRAATGMDWENGTSMERNNYRVLAAAQAEYNGTGVSRWAMSYLRRPALGPAWEFHAPGLGADRPPDAKTFTLGAGTSHELKSRPLAFGYADLHLEDDVEVVRLEPHAEGAVHWGAEANGPDDLFKEETGTKLFCVDPEACQCPEGTEETEAFVPLEERNFSELTVSFFGIHPSDMTNAGALNPRVIASAYKWADVMSDACRDRPVDYDVSVCESYFPDDALAATVPRDPPKHVIRETADAVQMPDAQGNPGATYIMCVVEVAGGTSGGELWYDWSVMYGVLIAVRGPESEQNFRGRWDAIAKDEQCTNVELDRGIVACVGTTRPGSQSILSEYSPNLFIEVVTYWTELDMSTDTAQRAGANLMVHATRQFGL